jgi:hypothetical protein
MSYGVFGGRHPATWFSIYPPLKSLINKKREKFKG